MESYGSYTKKFFELKKEWLQTNYPGITLERIRQELTEFSVLGYLNEKEFFDSPFLGGQKDPVNIFFESLKKGRPLEYIKGSVFFYRSKFLVNSDVLIPRFETEQLIEIAVSEVKKNKEEDLFRVLDCGVGSGAIIISLLQDCDREIKAIGTDISHRALDVAQRNYYLNRFTIPENSELKLYCTDRLKGDFPKQNLIVSNPPYIMKNKDQKLVHQQVSNFEPEEALYLEDDNYFMWFEELFVAVKTLLKEEGIFLMEGHESHLQNLKDLANKIELGEVSVLKDLAGKDRFLRAQKRLNHG
jgi:release factor glutamine methyltransferase